MNNINGLSPNILAGSLTNSLSDSDPSSVTDLNIMSDSLALVEFQSGFEEFLTDTIFASKCVSIGTKDINELTHTQ